MKPVVILVVAPLVGAFAPSSIAVSSSTSLAASYLDNLSAQQQEEPASAYYGSYLESLNVASTSISSSQTQPTNAATSSVEESTGFCHVPIDYFAFDNLSSKGPRATSDWGAPQDWSRKLADDGVFSAGTWYCTEGGWDSPNGKAVTEVFYMLEGHGMLGE